MRNILIPFTVALVAVAVSYYLYSTAEGAYAPDTSRINPGTVDAQDYFDEKLRAGVIDRIGLPIEGFVPFMFMQAFPGLVAKDFDGANGLLGEYRIEDTELVFVVDGSPIHSAAPPDR